MGRLDSKGGLSVVLLVFALFVSALLIPRAHAADLTIVVVEIGAKGQQVGPLAGASVCYNSADGCSGSKGTTGIDGRTAFTDVPTGTITVKASKTGFIGNILTFDVITNSTVQQVALRQGLGPALACLQPRAFQVGSTVIQSLTINGGAPSTTSRDVTLTFTTAGGHATAYRIAEPEAGVLFPGSITTKPFISIPCTSVGSNLIRHTLNVDSNYGARYGNRLVALQIKSGTHISTIKTANIRLDPAAMRDYVLTGRDKIQEVLDFAAANGFRHTAPAVVETCTSKCTGSKAGKLEALSTDVCMNLVRGVFFQGRALNPLWNVTTIGDLLLEDPPYVGFFGGLMQPPNVTSRSVSEINEDVFRVEFRITMPVMPLTIGSTMADFVTGTVRAGCFDLGDVGFRRMVISGPGEDDFVDPANPWKNAFIRR